MARLLPFYRTGGLLSGGGGGGPLGDATVWPQVADWAALGTIAGPLRTGDRVLVYDLLPGFGTAQYDGTDWRLAQAIFPTEADLLAFGQLIQTGALALVGTGGETDPVYYYSGLGAWERTPDGVHYIWQDRIDWADLSTVPDPQIDDEALVTSIGPGNATGAAIWTGAEWQLYRGIFDTVADMVAFAEPVQVGAIAGVEASGDNNENAVRYQYDGAAWARSAALSSGYAWTLSSLNDFSAVGLKDGDFGVYTAPAGGLSVVLRYNAAVPRESGAGGGFVPAWLPPEVYAGTPRLQAYLVGTESVTNDVTLNAQGWGTVTRTIGTITSQTTRVRLATTGASADVKISTLNSGVETTTKMYCRALTRMAVGNAGAALTTFCCPGASNNGASGIIPAYVSTDTTKGTYFWTGSGTSSQGVDKASQATVAGLTSSDDMIEVIVNTTGGLRACDMHRNGVLVSSTNLVAAPSVGDRLIYQAASFASATQTATLDVSQVQVFTW